uniref:stress response protein NST1 n=1 Tax=Scatophagus argus TaxID=75038 RepID=UPI001ED803CA|nr:stress response protein NST1 [Scatophagus argus]
MEESYETFEEELGPPRADPPPQKPVRQIRRAEMYTTRKVREETTPAPQQPRAEPKTLPREPSFPKTTSLHKALSIQNLSQIETPWENVTLNRCLFVAITILVLTSGFQRLHETLRVRGTEEEEEVGLTVRRYGTLRHRGQLPEPELTLWEVMFWWLPDLDDEEDEDDDDDDDGEVKRVKPKRRTTAQASRGLRNKPLLDNKLMKRRIGKLKDRRAKKARDEEIKDKKERGKAEDPIEAADEDEDEGREEAVPKKNKKLEKQKERKKTQKG